MVGEVAYAECQGGVTAMCSVVRIYCNLMKLSKVLGAF